MVVWVFTCLALYAGFVRPALVGRAQHSSFKSGYHNGVYFTNWGIYGADYQPASLPASSLSHVYYAFADIQPSAWTEERTNACGCVRQLFLLKKKHRKLKVILSVGGWTYAPKFPAAASTAESRAAFASSAVARMTDWGFDGINIDWEWQSPPPTQADATNFVLLLQAVRAALDAAASQSGSPYRFLLTVAAPAGPVTYRALELKRMATYADYFNIMGYDYTGSFSAFSGHQANLFPNPDNPNATPFSTEQAVADYLAAGVPARKLVLGAPAYGRYFSDTSGPGQSFVATSGSVDVYKYNTLPKPNAVEMGDRQAGATYSYDSAKRELVSYDTVESIQDKVLYLTARLLSGILYWEASGDRNDSRSLVATSFVALNETDSSLNLLDYPCSRYSNIAKGVP